MALNDVLSRLVIANSDDVQTIRDAVTFWYTNSSNAQTIFDFLVSQNRTLEFIPDEQTRADRGEFKVYYNPGEFDEKYYISSDGTFSEYTLEKGLMHEIIHAVSGASDGVLLASGPFKGTPANLTTPYYDYVGDTVRIENAIYLDAYGAQAKDRASYYSTLYKFEVEQQLDTDLQHSLTDGHHVGLVLEDQLPFNHPGANKIDTSERTDDVLLMGMSGSDQIRAGTGNDYLYGGTLDDTLIGGIGADKLYGNADNDILIGGNWSQPSSLETLDLTADHREWNDHAGDILSGGKGNDTYLISTDEGETWDWAYLSEFTDQKAQELLSHIDTIDESRGDGVGSIKLQVYHEYWDPGEQFQVINVGGAFDYGYSDPDSGVAFYYGSGVQVALFNVIENGDSVPYLFVLTGYPASPVVAIKDFYQGDLGISLEDYARTRPAEEQDDGLVQDFDPLTNDLQLTNPSDVSWLV
ncbi:hypothetical protein ATY76_24695 [Rhizobium sp. R339]|uniref:calcium-binding protein n=1 Tax=Rhizobium sp. R339 TaxID=1764273 RepID=UPI000B530D85|nr:calcium-binding protein [Rhizobium sp. R339]OWV75009.1 hypothetical protein ATY76_24695 [Rhizobium sp. R339]